jgi:preprotein translocase SecE subunit
MADDKSSDSAKKRRVRNPETFRERALKAAETIEQPKRANRLKQVAGRVLTPAAHPIGRAASKIFNRQPFKLIGKIIFPIYLRNSWRELKLVTWPTKKQSRKLTFAVLVFAVIFGATIALVDFGLDKLFKQILLK